MPENVEDVSAQSVTLSTLLGGDHRFEVPDYQRQYSWKKEQWETFWRDIQNIERKDETHFLGSVLLIKRDTGFGERDVYDIVDGQQRLATVSILLSVIRERLEQEGERSKSEGIEKYLIDEDSSGSKRQNVELNSLDNNDFQRIINGNSAANEESQLWQAAEYFAEKIRDLNISEIEKVRDKVLEAMPVVLIETYDEDSAFLLFETLNDRGLELSNVDLMKNTLLKNADKRNLDYNSIKQGWEDTVSDLRYSVDKPERFFRHYLMYSPKVDIKDSISRHTVLNHFKDIINNKYKYNISSIKEFVDDINKKARLYKNIVNANISRYRSDTNDLINQKLSSMSDFGSTQERTLLLYLLSEINNESNIIRGISLVEAYNVRVVIAGNTTGSTINQFYATTCSSMENSDNPIDKLRRDMEARAPSDEEFEISIRQNDLTRSDRTRYILEKYEREYYDGKEKETGEIEHIAPRSAFDAEKYSSWVTYLDVGKDEFVEYKDKIGNLTLMEKRLNIAAGNEPFAEKKKEYQRSEFEITREILDYTEWSVEKIDNRTQELAEQAPEIWSFNY